MVSYQCSLLIRFAQVAIKEKGVTYSRSATGTGMPHRNAFRHARLGRAFNAVLWSKFHVSLRTAAEATQICLDFYWFDFLPDGNDSKASRSDAQAGFVA